MDQDIFGTDGDLEEDSQNGGWDEEVNPQLFTSANIFSSDPQTLGDGAGELLGGTDDVLADLFGAQSSVVRGATVGTTPPPALPSERGAPVSFFQGLLEGC